MYHARWIAFPHKGTATTPTRMLRLARGARILTSSALTKGGSDVLQGTQHLMTAIGREKLKDSFRNDCKSGADAVMTAIDTSFDHLDRADFFADYTRDNDLSYYVVGKGNGEGGYELQGNGKKFLIPRGAGVSLGEKRDFAGVLCNLATTTAKLGRAEATGRESVLLGATIQFSSREDGTHLADGSLHLGNRMEAQITSAAEAQPDFFAVAGCTSARDVELVATTLDKHTLRKERGVFVDLRGFDQLDENPSTLGFAIPALLLLNAAADGAALHEMAAAAAKSAHIGGIAVVDAPLSDAEADTLHGLLAEGAILAGRSADAEQPEELIVLR